MKTRIIIISIILLIAKLNLAQETSKTKDTIKSKELTSSHELKSKKGEIILPEAGNYAFGIDASPFFTYLGGLFSNAGGTTPTPNFLNNQTNHS